jgi:predicted N-formylglutamate amidohydrolase
LLHDDEPPAWEVINAQGSSRLVLVCDHASPTAPLRLQNLGITEEQLTDHIGWDGGAADVARNLSARLQAPLLLTNYSRLVIDCN